MVFVWREILNPKRLQYYCMPLQLYAITVDSSSVSVRRTLNKNEICFKDSEQCTTVEATEEENMDKDDLKIEDVEMKTEQQIAEVEGKEEQDRKKEESPDVDVLSQKREDKDDLKIEDVEMKTKQQIAEVEGKEEQDRKKEESPDVDVFSQKTEEMSSSYVSEVSKWITGFCQLKRNTLFCEVDVDYIRDSFNLKGLERRVRFDYQDESDFDDAVTKILYGEEPYRPSERDEYYSDELTAYVYAQIHSRFIMTKKGIEKMVDKWKRGDFGHCPRIFCDNQNALPIGLTGEKPPKEYVCMYCPKCQDVFEPKRSHYFRIDGEFFENFPHMLFMVHPEYRPQPPATQYVPKLYGFKINKLALDLQYEAASKVTDFKAHKLALDLQYEADSKFKANKLALDLQNEAASKFKSKSEDENRQRKRKRSS